MSNGNLVTAPPSSLAMLLGQDADLRQMLEADREQQADISLSGVGLPPYKRLVLPKSGGNYFEMSGEHQTFKFPHVIGHIVHIQPFRQYWTGGRLLCQSDNGICSLNDRNLLYQKQTCAECPHSAFHNLPDGTSERPACSRKYRLFFLPCLMEDMANQASPYSYPVKEDGTLVVENVGHEPMYLDVPPTSLKAVREYFDSCSVFRGRLNLPYTALVTLFKSSTVQGAEGPYAQLSLTPIAEVLPYQYKYGKYLVEKLQLKVSKIDMASTSGEGGESISSTVTSPASPQPSVQQTVQAPPKKMSPLEAMAAAIPSARTSPSEGNNPSTIAGSAVVVTPATVPEGAGASTAPAAAPWKSSTASPATDNSNSASIPPWLRKK